MGTLIGSKFLNQNAANTNGTDEHFYRNNPSFKSDTSGCISFWYKPTTLLTGTDTSKTIIGLGVNDAGNNSFLSLRQRVNITAHSTNNYISILHRATNGATANQIVFSTTALTIGAWNHITVMSSGTSWSARVNDVSQTVTVIEGSNTGDWFGDISGSDHRMTFGGLWISNAMNVSQYNACTLDEIIYVNRTVTSGENTLLYNAGTPRNPYRVGFGTAWKMWLRCGDSRDSATTIFDEVGSNDFTLVNMDASNYVTP